jgi:hypothetical protein
MSSSKDASDPLSQLLASIPPLTPVQQARREREFQAFVRDWCKDPWNAEQAALHGEGWLRACFGSAALAYAGGRDEDEGQSDAAASDEPAAR